MLEIFSNREISLFIWGVLFLILILFKKDIRKSILDVLKTLFHIKIILPIIFAAFYSVVIVFSLAKINFWEVSFLKDTLFWFFGVAFIMIMHSNDMRTDENYLKKVVLENLKLILILEFILNFYVYSLTTELILLPILIFISLLAAVAETKKEYKIVHKLMENVLSVLGIIFFIVTIYKVVHDFFNFASLYTVKSFFLPIILTISYLPYIYLLALYSSYELLFIRIDFREKEETDFYSYAKRKILLKCHFNLGRLRAISRNIEVITAKTKEELRIALTH